MWKRVFLLSEVIALIATESLQSKLDFLPLKCSVTGKLKKIPAVVAFPVGFVIQTYFTSSYSLTFINYWLFPKGELEGQCPLPA